MIIREYCPPTAANRAEHRRIIREMGRGCVPPNPIARAVCEIIAAAFVVALWASVCFAVVERILTA